MSLAGQTGVKYLLVIEKQTAASGQHFQQKNFLNSLLNSITPYLTMLSNTYQTPNIVGTVLNYCTVPAPDLGTIPKELQAQFLSRPLHNISSDLYDHWQGPAGSLYLFLGDLAGHDLPTAYCAKLIKGFLRDYRGQAVPLADIMRALNDKYCQVQKQGSLSKMFTGIILKIDPAGILSSVSAGHPPLLIVPVNGKPRLLPQKQLGTLPPFGSSYEKDTLNTAQPIYRLKEGDRLFIYTDGLIERKNMEDKGFGLKNLTNYLRLNRKLDLEQLINGLEQSLNDFAEGRKASDDLTLIGLEYTP
jgi:sigma-B regulation protein RsbU (phosphoserine phosphatase)